jgi:hypothetical protein
MATLVLTGWSGTPFAKIACHTLPLLEEYALRHGHDFACTNLHGDRPPSWMKVPALVKALTNYDRVAWIDADVVVADPSVDICGELGDDHWQALVEHHTPSGSVPNCGVWVVTSAMAQTLCDLWNEHQNIHHPWWEQSSVIAHMGYVVGPGPTSVLDSPTTLYERTTFLDPTWNHHPHDARRVATPRFIHVTQYADRAGEARRLAQQIAAQATALPQ